jgi:hypothetical protein
MKTIFIILLIIISYPTQAQKEEYFKHLVFRETPYSFTKGRIPISVERSTTENHYKLSYNSNNQLVLIEYRFRNVLINRKRAGIMDGFRNIATKTKIEHRDDKEIRTFYDVNDIQCTNPMNVYKEVYGYNKNGERTSVKFYDKNDQLINNSWQIAEYSWTIKNDNSIIEKRKNTDGVCVTLRPYYKFMTTLYKYTNDGILISMNHIDEGNKLIEDESGVAINKAEYDADLNLVSFKFYNSKNEPVIGSFLKSGGGKIDYDVNGNCIKYSTVNLENNLMMSRNKAFDLYQFDAAGNLVEISSYDIDSVLLKIRNSVKTKFIYDNNKPFKHIKTEYYHNE